MESLKIDIPEAGDYSLALEFVKSGEEAFVFLHLNVFRFNKTVFKKIKMDLEVLIEEACLNGVETLDFIVPRNVGVKFHNKLRPLDYCFYKPDHIVGGWFTEG